MEDKESALHSIANMYSDSEGSAEEEEVEEEGPVGFGLVTPSAIEPVKTSPVPSEKV